jgi:acyl carrier protein
MGLDIVEMIMEIEEKFGVFIPDRDAERITTLGQLHQWLLRQRGLCHDSVCLSSAVFYRARRALCEQFGHLRHAVAPCTPLEGLVPAPGRRRHWQRFREALTPFAVPELQRPDWLLYTLGIGWTSLLLGGLAVGALLCLLGYSPVLAGLIFLVATIVCVLSYQTTRPLAVCLPAGCGTMAGLVRRTLGPDRDQGHRALQRMSERQVWDQMCQIVAEHLSVDPARLKPETSFIDDLRLY